MRKEALSKLISTKVLIVTHRKGCFFSSSVETALSKKPGLP